MVIIDQTDRFILKSTGNGAAFEFIRKARDTTEAETKFIQYGDDAAAFREEYENMEAAYANPASVWHRKTWNACLTYLFEDCA